MDRKRLTRYPALRLGIPFAVGAVAGVALPPDGSLILLALPPLVVLHRLTACRSLSIVCMLVVSGVAFAAVGSMHRRPFVDFADFRCEVFGVALQSVDSSDARWRCLVGVDSVRWHGTTVSIRGRCLVRVAGSRGVAVVAGSRVALVGLLSSARRDRFGASGARFELSMERGEDVHCVGEAGLIDRLAEEVRMYIRQVIRRRISGDAAGIARALLLGERADLDRETMESFRLTGTIHVLALSGMHVGVIASGLALLTSRIRSRETGYVLFAVVLMLYDIVVGPSPSIVRASIMSVVIVGARLLGRRTDPLNSLCGAALIIVACDTYALFDVSFLLSFAAVAGIVLFGMPLAHSARVKRMGHARSLARAGAVTLGAQVGTTPIMLATFGAVPLFSVIANLAVVPTVSWGMIGAIGCVAVESLSPSIATTLGVGARVGLELAVTCSSALAPSMSATSFVSRIAMWEALASTVALVVVAASRSKPLRMASIGCAVALWCLPAIHGAGTDDGCVRITVMPTASSNVVMMSTASRIMVVYDGAVVSLARARSLLAGRVEDSAGVEWQDIREAPRSDEALFGTVRVVRSCRRAGESILRDGRYLAISIRPPAISAMTVVLDQNNCVVQHADR